jgi:hypothetical protein
MSIVWWGIAMLQLALGVVVIVSGLVVVFHAQIDPSSGPAGSFLSALPAWPLMLGSIAALLALRWLQVRLAAELR